MAEEEKGEAVAPAPAPAPRISPHYDDDVNAKWDACADLSIRRVFYSTLSGAFVGLLLFRKLSQFHPPFFLYILFSFLLIIIIKCLYFFFVSVVEIEG